MTIIGFIGKKGSGKDTAADFLCSEFGFKKVAFADPLKRACRELFSFNDEQLYGDKKETVDAHWKITPRETLQFIGTEVFREHIQNLIPHVKNNFWVERLEKEIINNNFNYAISDVRFKNEIDMIKKLGGIIIKIERNETNNNFSNHISETEMDNINIYDNLILNDGALSEFEKKIKLIVNIV